MAEGDTEVTIFGVTPKNKEIVEQFLRRKGEDVHLELSLAGNWAWCNLKQWKPEMRIEVDSEDDMNQELIVFVREGRLWDGTRNEETQIYQEESKQRNQEQKSKPVFKIPPRGYNLAGLPFESKSLWTKISEFILGHTRVNKESFEWMDALRGAVSWLKVW